MKWLLRLLTERERQRTLLDALATRVAQLERERADMAIEHLERVDKLDALLRRMATRQQRAEAPSSRTEPPKAVDRTEVSPLDFKRALEARRSPV